MVIPLGIKRRVNRLARGSLFDLSVYERFAPRGAFRQDTFLEVAHLDDAPPGDRPRLLVHTPHPGVGNLGIIAQLLETPSDSNWEVSVLVNDSPAGIRVIPTGPKHCSGASGDLHAQLGISPHKKLIFFDVPWFMVRSVGPIAAALAEICEGEDFNFTATVDNDQVDAFRRAIRARAVELRTAERN